MDLKETSPVPTPALPIAAFRDHLRLSSGFADDVTQDGLLELYLRSALAAIEGRVSRALLRRDFTLTLSRWRDAHAQILPIAPVAQIHAVTLIDRLGGQTLLDPARYVLRPDAVRPALMPAGVLLPAIPTRGQAEIAFAAGFGPAWGDVPADLRQAVFLLAAQYYEARDTGPTEGMDFGIRALLERWRDIRIGGRRA